MALARAAMRGRSELSPAPADGSSGWLICTMLIPRWCRGCGRSSSRCW
jgi:hypothetical protein